MSSLSKTLNMWSTNTVAFFLGIIIAYMSTILDLWSLPSGQSVWKTLKILIVLRTVKMFFLTYLNHSAISSSSNLVCLHRNSNVLLVGPEVNFDIWIFFLFFFLVFLSSFLLNMTNSTVEFRQFVLLEKRKSKYSLKNSIHELMLCNNSFYLFFTNHKTFNRMQ